jgi:hypothetical protein
MWSMWNAPSDRDYYDPQGMSDEREEENYCHCCGARDSQICEPWCASNSAASEAASVSEADEPADPPRAISPDWSREGEGEGGEFNFQRQPVDCRSTSSAC